MYNILEKKSKISSDKMDTITFKGWVSGSIDILSSDTIKQTHTFSSFRNK